MSSTYRAICMGHDPAIEIDLFDDAHRTDAHDVDTALRLLSAAREKHPGCDLLIGRYSYPLQEVFCPPSEPDRPGCPVRHPHGPNRIDLGWLRLLYHARQVPATAPLSEALALFDRSCWGPRRVERLMRLVGDEYASTLEPLVDPLTLTPIGTPPDTRVSRVNGEEYLAHFHGGEVDGRTVPVLAKPFDFKPFDPLRIGPDTYRRDDLPDAEGVWHYRVKVSS